jgi:hypothetical protein
VKSSAAHCVGVTTCPEQTTCSEGACRNECSRSQDCLVTQNCSVLSVCVGTDVTRDPGAVNEDGGPGGASSGGGTTGTGARSGAGGRTGTGGKSAGGAAPVDGGDEPGEAGVCTATGPEDCFNGKDDDCNGTMDCEDPACDGAGTCVPDAPGATFGTFILPGGCPTGYSPVPLNHGITATYGCTGCSCVPNNDARCESGVYGHGPYTCPSYQFSGPLYNVIGDRCDPMPPDASLHYYDVRGFVTCSPQGTGTPYPASWTESRVFCAANKAGGGCGAGSRCVPKVPVTAAQSCTMTTGAVACGAKYPATTGETWYTGYTDDRQCLACSCSFGGATCSGAYIQGYSGASCSGTPVTIGNGAEGDACPLGIVTASAKVVGTPTNPSCESNTGMTGALTATGPRTVCCQ